MSRLRRILWGCLAMLVATGFVHTAVAAGSAVEELTKVLPDGTVYFIATSGGDALKDDCAKSILGRICHDPGVESFVTQIKTQVMAKIQEENDEVPQMIGMGLAYGQLLLKRPLVVGVARAETPEGPPACLFGILNAGDRQSELMEVLTKIEGMIGEDEIAEVEVNSLKMHSLKDTDDVPLYWGWVDNYLMVCVNDPQGIATKYVADPRETATDHLKKVPGHGDVLVVYEDFQQIWQIIQSFAFREGGQDDLIPVKLALDELGISKLGKIVARVGLSGADLVSGGFFEVPEPRTGLFAASKPVDVSMLKMVDAQAINASIVNFDLAHVFDTVMNTLKVVSPDEGYPEVQKGLADFESEAGFRIRDGVLKSLAGPIVFYSLPAGKMVEAPMGGAVAVLKLSDAELFEKNMTALGAFIAQHAEGMLQVGSQTDDEGRTVHVWASPALAFAQVMPTWSVVGDQVVIGSNTALCTVGIKAVAAKGEGTSLVDTEGFKKVAAGLPENLLSLTYVDSQVQFSQMMIQLQQVWPMATMGAMRAGFKLPVMLPNLSSIVKDMQPACEYGYAGPDGFYSRYRGPGVEVSLRGVAVGGLAAGIAMPALARTRQQAFRMTSGTNLAGIGKACLIYANDHDDQLPPDLETLVDEAGLSPKSLESKRRPEDFDGPSYVYVPGQTTAMYPGNIVAYEDPRYCSDGVNVLFLDSHVEFMKPDDFKRELRETYERLDREMPEVRFEDEWDDDVEEPEEEPADPDAV